MQDCLADLKSHGFIEIVASTKFQFWWNLFFGYFVRNGIKQFA